MENWYEELVRSEQIPAGAVLDVTGYSLGGHLATAFSELYGPDKARAIYTFNGAGVGTVTAASLANVVEDFQSRRNPNLDLSSVFSEPGVRALYLSLRNTLRDGGTASAEQRAAVHALWPTSTDPHTQVTTLLPSIKQMKGSAALHSVLTGCLKADIAMIKFRPIGEVR